MSIFDSASLCHFCASTDWEQLTTGVFNIQKAPLDIVYSKHGEHNLGVIRSNEDKCELCGIIGRASLALKPWWPIGEFLDRPDQITCAFFNSRNRLGEGVLNRDISQTQMLLDQLYAQMDPKFSSVNLTKREFFDYLTARGVHVDGQSPTNSCPRRNSSLNRLLVMAGLPPVRSTSQMFMQLHPCLHPVPRVEDYTTANPPFSAFPTGRIVESKVNIDLLKKWYNTCLDSHGSTCDQPCWLVPGRAWPQSLRVVDVRQRCLVDAPTTCPYFALSYVWGEEENPVQTTSRNLAALQVPAALDSQSLPRTIEDALCLTGAMGIDYLWVDRLCVIQDSDADKAVQLRQMDLVYSSAAVTIVAATGTATDGLSGVATTPRIIDQRIARVAQNLSLMDVLRLDDAYQNCAWRTRGWTFQEGVCSRRSLVVTTDQVFWSCESAKYCETIAFEDFPTSVKPGDSVYQVLSGHEVFGDFGGANFSYAELASMIRAYNGRFLRYQGDALDAFIGVLNRVEVNNPGHQFHWGHSVSCMFDLSLAWANIVWNYDAEVAANKVNMATRRRAKHHVFATASSAAYDIPIPSWSWLGWVHLEGITRVIPKQVNIPPELEIMKLDVHGKAWPLRATDAPVLEDMYKINMCGIDASTSAGWKEDTSIPSNRLFTAGGVQEFRDSGRLLFWTSHAELRTEGGKIYASAPHSSFIISPAGSGSEEKEKDKERSGGESESESENENGNDREIGELLPMRQYQFPKPHGTFSFVVVSRKNNDYYFRDVRAERKLYLLLVEWVDRESHVAERLYSAEVDEEAWVAETREWILLTLA